MMYDAFIATMSVEERQWQSWHLFDRWQPPCGGWTYQLDLRFLRIGINRRGVTNGKYCWQFHLSIQL